MRLPNRTRQLLLLALVAVTLGLSASCGGSADDLVATSTNSETVDDSETSDQAETSDEPADAEVTDEGEPIPIDLDALAARTWTLRFGGGPTGEIPMVEGNPITITFRDGDFTGTAACNGYGGKYTIDGSRLTLIEIGAEDMDCAAEIQASEAAFMTALMDVDGINLLGNEMALSGMATELIFAPVTP